MTARTMCRFVCFEGIDGSGKSTLARLVTKRLQDVGVDAVLASQKTLDFADPFVRSHMTTLKRMLWDYPTDANISLPGDRHWLHLLSAWYAALDAAVVRPRLESGQWVICDGWVYKYLARFALKPHIGEAFAEQCFAGLTTPDAVYYLDIDPQTSFARRTRFRPTELGAYDDVRGEPEASYIVYQSRVRDVYARYRREANWRRLDAGRQSPDELVDAVLFQGSDFRGPSIR